MLLMELPDSLTARLRAFLEATPDMLVRINRDGLYLDYQTGRAVDRFIPESAIGTSVKDHLPPDVARLELLHIEETLRTGRGQTYEYQLPVQGQTRYYEARTEVSGPDEVLIVVRDITDRKEMQAQLARTSKMITMGEMASGVAHELNQPLHIIRMAAQLIEDAVREGDCTTEFLLERTERIIGQVDRASAVINNLRVFAHRTSDTRRFFDLNEPLKEALSMLSRQLQIHEIYLDLHLAAELPPVAGSQSGLEQVFINVILNARDALENRTAADARLKVTTLYDQPSDEVIACFENNGPQIPADQLDRIFEPFYTTKEVGQGTGLGLSLSYGIVRDHQGHIDVKSDAERTEFRICLPVKRES
ncbi:MAG: PAS domain-containing protein [Spirochaetales bacterium]|nr:PAS domain-containing protein [Spirochaetales bacterium]